MLLKQTQKTLKLLLPLLVIFAFAMTHFSTVAFAAGDYVDVDRDNTLFYYNADKNVFLAVRDGNIVIFGKEAGNDNGWKQKVDLYGKGTIDCSSRIQIDKAINPNIFNPLVNRAVLYEAGGNNCADENYHQGAIDLQNEDESVTKAAQNINWGNEPLGCPKFGNIPNNANKKDLNYNCPNGGAVIKGVYDKNEKIDTPRLASANASACGDVAGAFGWLICEPAEKIGDFTMWFEKQLYTLLHINELPLAADGGVYQAWASIRTVATTVLVLVALVAIASQIFNFDFISAYTIKKIIPKIVIATILIFTSYYLAAMGIAFVNALGDGVNALILAPFPDLMDAYNQNETISFVLSNISGIGGGEAGVAGGIIVGAGIAAIGGAGLFGLLIPIILVIGAVVVAFITLVLRKVFILALVLIMPLAIVAWILPGTQKWFDSWWKLFSKLLLMYPLVIGLLAVGKVAAYLIATGTESVTAAALPQVWNVLAVNGQASIVILMVLIAYFGPYYFIPSMFKTAGGVFGKITSGMQSFGSKYARKGGEASSKWVGDRAASRYRPGAKGARKFIGNSAIRLGTGKLLPTQSGARAIASRGVNFEKERLQQAEFLHGQAERSMDHNTYLDYLEKTGSSRSIYDRQAAHNILVRQKGYDQLERLRDRNGEEEWNRMISVGDTYSAIKSTNRSVLTSDTALAIEDGSIFDDTEEKKQLLNKYYNAARSQGVTNLSQDEFVTDLKTRAGTKDAVREARKVDKAKIIQEMSGDEIIASHDSIYFSQDFDSDGKPKPDKIHNVQFMSDASKESIAINQNLVGRATATAKRELGLSGGGGGSGGGGNSGPSSGGGGGSGQSAPAGPGYVAPMPPPTPGTAYTGLTPPAAPAKVVLDETSIRELANNVRESGGKGLSKEDRRDISQETAERIENIERTRNDDGPPV